MTSYSLKDAAFGDLQREFTTTRKVLERLPEKDFAFKPHEKSMHLGRLAMHVATLPQWMLDALNKDELDLATATPPRKEPTDRDDLLRTFDENVASVNDAMAKIDDAGLMRTWTARHGPQILTQQSRLMILRVWCVNHMIHHRAQLCIYLRLLNVSVPAIYFNSADEPEWIFA